VRCSCGGFITAQQKRCRKCAVEFARGIDTDRFEMADSGPQEQEEIPPVLPPVKKKQETTARFNPNAYQAINMAEVWAADRRRRRFWRITFIVSLILLTIMALVWYRYR